MADESQPENLYHSLRRLTPARVALGRVGDALPTHELLAFQRDHARARDAVHTVLDADVLAREIEALGCTVLRARSAAATRETYLRRPDLGRHLDEPSRQLLAQHGSATGGYDAAFVVADGLSAQAAQQHAAPLLANMLAALRAEGWRLAPVVVAEQTRVALGDEAGELLGAQQVAVLLGERPGLSVADSLGVYLTYAPRVGRSDAERNCVSNIHAAGLGYAAGADTLLYLMRGARRLRLSGVALKDERGSSGATLPGPAENDHPSN